ncbi:MAG: RnfABCDGE type electron transport complex subunit G [Bacteroidota bacterium]
MAKKESTFINMVLTLFVVTLLASTSLGYIYEITKGPIARTKKLRKLKAIKQVVPEFTNNPDEEKYKVASPDGLDSLVFYPAKKDGEIIGTAIETYTTKGFSGLIKIMAGFKPDGSIYNISVLEHKETPGLGTKMADAKFKNQFVGINPSDFLLKVKKDGGQVDAITAATISSRAFCDAVQKAHDAYNEHNLGN